MKISLDRSGFQNSEEGFKMVKDVEIMDKGWRLDLPKFKTTCKSCRALVIQPFKNKLHSKLQKEEAH